MKHMAFSSLMVLSLLGLFLAGCGSTEPTTSGDKGTGDVAADQSHEGQDSGVAADQTKEGQDSGVAGESDMAKMKKALAELDPEDAAAAEKQHFCPVSGRMLGTMGTPKKVTVKGRDVWICCDGCKDKLLADPDTYLAKLDE